MRNTVFYAFAHPDDESFTCGGTIFYFSHIQEKRQVLFCATRGEAGKRGNPPICEQHELGRVRERELKKAAQILGLDHIILRDYGDGKLHALPRKHLVNDLLYELENEKPEMIITFPPSGISGHRDHQVIQEATLEAVQQLSYPTSLYYIVIPESMKHFYASYPYTVPDSEVDLWIDIRPYRKQVALALQAHKSQHLSLERAFPGLVHGQYEQFRTHECYQLALKNRAK